MGHDLSKIIDTSIFGLSDSKVSQRTTTIAPNYNNAEVDSSLNTLTLIPKLLEESEEKLKSNDYEAYLSLLRRASNLGSGLAAAKLGFLYLNGLQDPSTNIENPSSFKYVIAPNYKLSTEYYFLALKIINLIVYTLWDMKLLLETVISITELYRYKFNRKRDVELWNNGLVILKQLDSKLNETQFIKFQTHENNQIRNAIRIHILFIFALTNDLDRNFSDAMRMYQDCKKIGPTSISFSADKLIKKAHTNSRLIQKELDKEKQKVLPICIQCNFEPKDKAETWKLLICAKCQQVACCSRQCLQLHMADDH